MPEVNPLTLTAMLTETVYLRVIFIRYNMCLHSLQVSSHGCRYGYQLYDTYNDSYIAMVRYTTVAVVNMLDKSF